jgi:NAD(P)-dependent dehydrogenase (short-subunit alcohol dehydrogenase family)
MIGGELPGPGALWFGQELTFEEPVYIGDRLTITVRIVQVSVVARAVRVEVEARDQHGNVKLRGKGKVTMPKIQPAKKETARRTALVTGGSGGIGAAICQVLARAGMKVLVGYAQQADKAENVVKALRAEDGEGEAVALDLRDSARIPALLEGILGRVGEIDTVVCGAMATWRRKRFTDLAPEDFAADFGLAVIGHARLLQALLPHMAARKFGRVIGIASSVVCGAPPAEQASYVAAKYGLVGLFRALATEYSGAGITINLVSPSLVDTAFTRDLPERVRKVMMLQSPLGRLCTPADVAAVVELLARRDSYLHGVNIPITGGQPLA